MRKMKKLAVTALAGVSLAGAFVATQTQEVKAFTILSAGQKTERTADEAKKDLQETLDKRGFKVIEYGVDLTSADYYGSLMGYFANEYYIYTHSGPGFSIEFSETTFYDKINENLKANDSLNKIELTFERDVTGHYRIVSEGYYEVFNGIYIDYQK